jgi:DNA-binding winged helix-turn-helix (wHTH) protein
MSPETLMARDVGEIGPVPSVLSEGRYVVFGPFQVDQHRQEVTRNGTRLRLQGKVYQVLLALLEKPGEVVTREELRVRLWPAETHVNYDANVNTTVNKLRQALGDSSDKPLYIETIPRKGYSLIVQPEVSDKAIAPVVTSSNGLSAGAAGEAAAQSAAPVARLSARAWTRADMWVVFGVIGLILAGMLLGAGITRLWLQPHFGSGPGFLM